MCQHESGVVDILSLAPEDTILPLILVQGLLRAAISDTNLSAYLLISSEQAECIAFIIDQLLAHSCIAVATSLPRGLQRFATAKGLENARLALSLYKLVTGGSLMHFGIILLSLSGPITQIRHESSGCTEELKSWIEDISLIIKSLAAVDCGPFLSLRELHALRIWETIDFESHPVALLAERFKRYFESLEQLSGGFPTDTRFGTSKVSPIQALKSGVAATRHSTTLS